MKKLFKNKVIVLLFSMIIFSNCFSANEDKSGFLSNIRELKELSDIMDILNENYVGEKKIDKKILLQGAVKGMLESLDDPHSNYFTKSELESFKEDFVFNKKDQMAPIFSIVHFLKFYFKNS